MPLARLSSRPSALGLTLGAQCIDLEQAAVDGEEDVDADTAAAASGTAESVAEAMRGIVGPNVGGRKRKRAESRSSLEQLTERAFRLIQAAWGSSSQSKARTALRRLQAWIMENNVREPFKMTLGNPAAHLHNELTLIQWAASMEEDGLAHGTIASYVSLAKTAIGVRLGWPLTSRSDEARLPRLLKGIRNARPAGARRRRLGWRARHMRILRERVGMPKGVEHTGADSVLNAARQGLLRAADFLPAQARKWSSALFPTVGDFRHLESGGAPYATILVRPAKKGGNKPKCELVHFPEGDGISDAYSSIRRHLAAREAAAGKPLSPDEPLFVHANGQPWLIREMRSLLRAAATLVGLAASEVGAHSARIGGATDLFSQGCPAAVIQILGRWDSDIWAIYSRLCVGSTLGHISRAAGANDVDIESITPGYAQPAYRG